MIWGPLLLSQDFAMNQIALAALAALLPSFLSAQQPSPKKAIRFPLRCDRSLPSDGTLFLLESAPISTLQEHGEQFFPYLFAKSGMPQFIFFPNRFREKGWDKFVQALPKIVEELKGFDRGFSFSNLYFPYKEGDRTRIDTMGFSLFGQTSNKKWLRAQWDRLAPIFRDPNAKIEESRPLGGSPITSNWIYEVFARPDGEEDRGTHGTIAIAHRGNFASIFTSTYYAWNEKYAKKELPRILTSGEKSLSVGLGIKKTDHKGDRIQGIEVFQPQGTTLGRALFHLGPYMDQTMEIQKGNLMIDIMDAVGFLSIQGIQDTVWIQDGITQEKIQLLEKKGRVSIFDAFAPLDSDASEILSLLPKKTFGFLRFRVRLDWLRGFFERTQKIKWLHVKEQRLGEILNRTRAFFSLPIPKNPASMEDLHGTLDMTAFFGPPSPGSIWPEIFLLTPKKEDRISPHERLRLITGVFYDRFLPRMKDDPSLAKNIQDKGKGITAMSYVNYGRVINGKRNRLGMPVGALPGAGIFSAAESKDYSILSFSPSAMRGFLKSLASGASSRPKWVPPASIGKKGDLLQGAFRLQTLPPVYPLNLVFAGFMLGSSKKKRKAPTSKEIAQLFSTEAFRIYRLQPQGDNKGLLVMDHSGRGLFSLFNWSALFFSGITMKNLSTLFI